MNSIKHMITGLCILSVFCYAESEASFLEKIAPLKKDLFKISAQELCEHLNVSSSSVSLISADTLKQLIESENDILVVNVLTPNYYHDCHITGSINVPLPELVDRANAWNRSQKIIIYCALNECDAGEKGCILLQCMGFTNVYDYRGGIKEWFQLGYPIVGPAESEYLHLKSVSIDECKLYPDTLVCSKQTRWIHKYQK